MKLIVGNWKANKTWEEIENWWKMFSQAHFSRKDREVVLCPPVVYLFPLRKLVLKSEFPFPVKLGVQDLSGYPGGTYTGEVTGRMVDGVASYAILGHSERRRWLKETVQLVARKAIQALDHEITPIVSVDQKNYDQQLYQFEKDVLPGITFMYEPPEAISVESGPIGEGEAADISNVLHMAATLKKLSPKSKILYGGSVKSDNVSTYISLPHIDGVVPGTASMNADEFIKLINQS
jgi:triosephosphate isomerase